MTEDEAYMNAEAERCGAELDDASWYEPYMRQMFRAGRAAGLREALAAEPTEHDYYEVRNTWRERIAALLDSPPPT